MDAVQQLKNKRVLDADEMAPFTEISPLARRLGEGLPGTLPAGPRFREMATEMASTPV
jgi:hypothetical protein